MSPQIRRSRVAVAALTAAFALATTGTGLPAAHAGQGSGNPVLTVSPATALPATGPTTVTVTGKDYLVPPHAAGTAVSGGIYVFFGWVDSTTKWGPSGRNINNTDGNFGTTYLYPGEQGSQDNQNAGSSIGNVAFTPGGEGADGSPTMNDNGDWTLQLPVPGATFTTALPGGGTRTTNCLQVTCGIFTIGAHGKASATNEKFTPVTFAGAGAATSTPTETPAPNSGGAVTTAGTTVTPTPTIEPLPKTGMDDRAVAAGAWSEPESGGGGGLALLGVAALAALVVALTASLVLRFRDSGGPA